MENTEKNIVLELGTVDSNDLLAAIHEASSDLIYLFDLETQSNLYASKSIADVLGYSAKEVKKLGANLLKTLVHPDDLALIPLNQTTIKQLKNGEIFHSKIRYITAQGQTRYFQSREMPFARNAEGQVKVILGITHDITNIEAQNEELKKMALIVQKTNNAVMILTRDEKIKWVNEGYEKLTGYTLAEVVGKVPRVFLQNDEHNQHILQQMRKNITTGKAFSGELQSHTKNNEAFWVRIGVDILKNEKNEADGFVFIGQDITELKQNEERLLQSYERLKKYAYFTSHQLRSPVADILSILDVYDYNNPLNADNTRLLNDLKTVSLRLDAVVHDLNNILSVDKVPFADASKKELPLKNIMLVDDDKIFINITGLILKRFNQQMQIDSYTNPAQALSSLQAKKTNPDAIFLDINMPEIDGWSFLENMAQMGITTNVYMLTSSIDPADMKKSRTYPTVKGYFTKPLTKEMLTEHFRF